MDQAVQGKKSPLDSILGGGAERRSNVDKLLGKPANKRDYVDAILNKSKGMLSSVDAILGKRTQSSVDSILRKSSVSAVDVLLRRGAIAAPEIPREGARGETRGGAKEGARGETRGGAKEGARGGVRKKTQGKAEAPERAPARKVEKPAAPSFEATFAEKPVAAASVVENIKVEVKPNKPVFDTSAPVVFEQLIQNQLREQDDEMEDLNALPEASPLTEFQEKSILRRSMDVVNSAFSVLTSSATSTLEKLSFSTVHSVITQTRNVGLELFAESYQLSKRAVKPFLIMVAVGFGFYFGILAWTLYATGGTFGMLFSILQSTCGPAVFGVVAEAAKRAGATISVDLISAYAKKHPRSHVAKLMNKKLTPRFCRNFAQRLGMADVSVGEMSGQMINTMISFGRGYATGGVIGGLWSVGTMTGINLGLKAVIKGKGATVSAAKKLKSLAEEIPKKLASRVITSKAPKEEPLVGAVEDVVKEHPEIHHYSVYRKPSWVPRIPENRLEEQPASVIQAIGKHKLKTSAAVGALMMTGMAFAGLDVATLLPAVGLPLGTVIPIPDIIDNDMIRGTTFSILGQYGVAKAIKKLKLNDERAQKLRVLYSEYTGGNSSGSVVNGIMNIITDSKVYTQAELKKMKPLDLKRLATQRYIKGRESAKSSEAVINLILKDQQEKANQFSKIIFNGLMQGIAASALENGLEAGYQAIKEIRTPIDVLTDADLLEDQMKRFDELMGRHLEKSMSDRAADYAKTQSEITMIKARFDDMVGNADLTTLNAMGALKSQLDLLHTLDKSLVEQARKMAADIEAAQNAIQRELEQQNFYLQTLEASVNSAQKNIEDILRQEADIDFYLQTLSVVSDKAAVQNFLSGVRSNMAQFNAEDYKKALEAQLSLGEQTWKHYMNADLPQETVDRLTQAYAEYEQALKANFDAVLKASSVSGVFQSLLESGSFLNKIIRDAYNQINDARNRWEAAQKAIGTAFDDAIKEAAEKGLADKVKELEAAKLRELLKENNPFMEISIPGQTYIGDGLAKGMEDLLPMSIREEMKKLEYTPFMVNAVAWGSLKVTGLLDLTGNINDLMRGAEAAKEAYKIGNLLNEIRTNADHISSLDYGKLDEILSKRLPDAYELVKNNIQKYNLGDVATELVTRGAREGWSRDRLVYELGVKLSFGDSAFGLPFSWLGEKLSGYLPE